MLLVQSFRCWRWLTWWSAAILMFYAPFLEHTKAGWGALICSSEAMPMKDYESIVSIHTLVSDKQGNKMKQDFKTDVTWDTAKCIQNLGQPLDDLICWCKLHFQSLYILGISNQFRSIMCRTIHIPLNLALACMEVKSAQHGLSLAGCRHQFRQASRTLPCWQWWKVRAPWRSMLTHPWFPGSWASTSAPRRHVSTKADPL